MDIRLSRKRPPSDLSIWLELLTTIPFPGAIHKRGRHRQTKANLGARASGLTIPYRGISPCSRVAREGVRFCVGPRGLPANLTNAYWSRSEFNNATASRVKTHSRSVEIAISPPEPGDPTREFPIRSPLAAKRFLAFSTARAIWRRSIPKTSPATAGADDGDWLAERSIHWLRIFTRRPLPRRAPMTSVRGLPQSIGQGVEFARSVRRSGTLISSPN